jgi:hypothetical protein
MDEPGRNEAGIWPGAGVLLVSLVILAAGYAAAIARGPAPASEVRTILLEAPGASEPAVP